MSPLNEYFSKIYCINLNDRRDRWKQCQCEFEKHDLIVDRFPAIKYNGIYTQVKAEVATFTSHKKILSEISKDNLQNVLILEDDVVFDNDLNQKFETWVKEVPDNWDMLYLGGNHNYHIGCQTKEYSEHLVQLTNTYAIHAYAINKNFFYTALNARSSHIIDVTYAHLQPNNRCFCFNPKLAFQRAGYSNIMGQYTDYENLK